MTASVQMTNILALTQLITNTENFGLIYWGRGTNANQNEKIGANEVANDCWAATTFFEHYISLLPPDRTTWTAEENNVFTLLQNNATAAQTKLDAILGEASQEIVRVNTNLATFVTSLLASL